MRPLHQRPYASDRSGISVPDRGYGVKDANRMVGVGNRSEIG